MTIVNTSDLTGAALDWAVRILVEKVDIGCPDGMPPYSEFLLMREVGDSFLMPSTDWAQGGPIIREHNIALIPPTNMVHRNGGPNAGWGPSGVWSATTFHAGWEGRRAFAHHETDPLIAAMRCLVTHRLGPVVDIPDDLLQ